jgi:hypothetical protein
MDEHELMRHVAQGLWAACNDDRNAFLDALDAITEPEDPALIYSACCGFAEAGRQAMEQIYGVTADPDNGATWGAVPKNQAAEHAPPNRWFSIRFLVAHANHDHDMTLALFNAAVEAGPDHLVDAMVALVMDAANLVDIVLKEVDA